MRPSTGSLEATSQVGQTLVCAGLQSGPQVGAALLLVPLAILLTSCRQDMHDQPRYRPLAASGLFPDGRSARPVVDGTVARGNLRTDARMYKGKDGDKFTGTLPVPLTRALLDRGRNRFNIYCTPCHGRLGDGEGMVVQRGFKHPPTYHQDRLRNQPAGYIFDIITNGYGSMISYAARVPVEDRWAIVAYVRALQLSQNANINDVPPADRASLDAQAPPGAQAAKPAQEAHH